MASNSVIELSAPTVSGEDVGKDAGVPSRVGLGALACLTGMIQSVTY